MSDKQRYISIALDPGTHAAFLEMASYRGLKPGALGQVIVEEWLQTEGSKMSGRVSIAMMASALKKDREVRDTILNEAKHLAAQIHSGGAMPEVMDKLTALCEHLGLSPEDMIEDAGTNADFIAPARKRTEEREAALIEIMTLNERLPATEVMRLWRDRGQADSMLSRTKSALASKGFKIVSDRVADGWYWSVDYETVTV